MAKKKRKEYEIIPVCMEGHRWRFKIYIKDYPDLYAVSRPCYSGVAEAIDAGKAFIKRIRESA
jgi:hypothetical protein